MNKPTPMSAMRNMGMKMPSTPTPSSIDMDNSGGATRGLDINKIPTFGVQKLKDKKTGKVRVQLNTPIQPTPAQPAPDNYDATFSKGQIALAKGKRKQA